MNAGVTLAFLALTLTAIPVHAGQYITEEQKTLLLEKSTALGLSRERTNAVDAVERSELENFLRTVPTSSNAVDYQPTPHTSFIAEYARTPKQSFQPKFNTASRSVPTYGNRPVKQSRQVSKTAPDYQSIKRSRQVSKTPRKKSNWSGFFKNLSLIAAGINSGMNQANSQQQSQQFFQQQMYQIQQNNNALMQYNNGFQNNFFNGAKRGYTPERVYTPGECLGTVVNGQCFGTISPAAKTRHCYGKMINGECIGTVK